MVVSKMSVQKLWVGAETLQTDSYELASKVYLSGFKPDFIVAIWRGGAQIGCCVQEFLKYLGVHSDHIAIRTSRYVGIDEVAEKVAVHNLGYLVERVKKDSKILLVDDVFDSGHSIEAIFGALAKELGEKMPTDIKVATVFYKPKRNKTEIKPDYWVHLSDAWIVFPHELEEMTLEEIREHKGERVAELIEQCKK